MSFLTPDRRSEDAEQLCADDEAAWGFVPNFAETFTLHPAAYRAWKQLNGAIRGGMEARRYELASVAAAAALGSSYCCLAHGRVLARDHLTPQQVIAMVGEPDSAPLDDADAAIVVFATKVARRAGDVSAEDVDRLRDVGLSDRDILDVTLAAAARCFFATVLDATGTLPDSAFQILEPRLRSALTVGRPIAAA